MDEREKLEETGNPAGPGLNEDARSVGEIVADLVAELGPNRAWLWSNEVNFGESVSGQRSPLRRSDQRARVGDGHEPLNSASVCEQRTRPHFAQRGIRSR